MSGTSIVAAEPSNQLARVVQQNNLEPVSAAALIEAFQPLFAEAESVCRDAAAIEVTDATQVSEIKKARAARLQLKDIRVRAEHERKRLKEDSLRRGKAIDGIANVIKFLVEPAEERLLAQEQFAERKEAERKAALRAAREDQLRPYGVDPSFYRLDDMPEAEFAQLVASSRAGHEARLEAARKEEEDRRARETADREEKARMQAENERLRKEAEEREAAMREERVRAEAERRAADEAARKEREALEAKARADAARAQREAAEQRRLAAEAVEAERKREMAERARLEAELKLRRDAADDLLGACQLLLEYADAVNDPEWSISATEKLLESAIEAARKGVKKAGC